MVINEQYMTPDEAARIKGISVIYVYKLVAAGKIASIKERGRLYLLRESVLTCDVQKRGRPNIRHDIELAKRCQQARLAAGLSTRAAAEKLDCSYSLISLQERGLRSISQHDLALMARAYGVSAKWLEFGHE